MEYLATQYLDWPYTYPYDQVYKIYFQALIFSLFSMLFIYYLDKRMAKKAKLKEKEKEKEKETSTSTY
ncbi:MAG TPA: hypothetical protein PLE30_11295 [Candidatus Kapabacteria bacterium]|nr:hypothetical protein [Candidatus Kapabacteria bacterium]